MKNITLLLIFVALATVGGPPRAKAEFSDFITTREGQLREGAKPFRFISFNIPNLTYTEDDMRFSQPSGFRLPTAYEINDALSTIEQMGGRVARSYVLSVRKPNDPPEIPRHILGPDQLNEDAMMMLDEALAAANRHGVRLIIPLIDNASWWGGIQEFAGFRGKSRGDFFTDPQIKDDYKHLVTVVLNRVNTKTGIRYKDDKAVLAWELGNELIAPKEWVREMAPFVKQIDSNHLVAESFFTDPDNPGVDIVQDHLYQGDPVKMIEQIQRSLKRNAGKKVYLVGEFGFITTAGMRSVIDTIIHEPAISGGLIWSLRYHNNDGGYYWHHEPFGGDFFKAYHWPGGPAGQPYDESHFMQMVREKAYEIQNSIPPPLPSPAPPELFRVTDGGIVSWRGSTGASSYQLQRAESAEGTWDVVADQLTDDATQYQPLACDETVQPHHNYWYRLIARNGSGESKPSNVFGPVPIRCRTLVDEFDNLSFTYRSGGKPEIRSNDARNYKEDCHRLAGVSGTWVAYHAPAPIIAIRVYAFGDKEPPDLEYRTGYEPDKGKKLEAHSQDFYAGKEMYNFRWPRLDTLTALPDDGKDVIIQFRKDAQIGRVEIEYQ